MKIITSFFLVFTFFLLSAQEKYTISGYVKDKLSGESLISASIYEPDLMLGTISNNYGFYSLTLPKGKRKIAFSYLGYKTITIEINLQKDTVIKFEADLDNLLQEVVIEDTREESVVEQTQMSTIEIPMKDVKTLPVLLGEVDIMKTIQLMPGVQSGSEGTGGLYVRGGGPDQNLILLDGVPVYNANHLFGFFSVFNADAIQSMSLIKGGFPARYSGRLSSVLDIRMKEGNMKKITGEVSIGLISSKATIEGPIIKDKTSFIVSARRTYIDILTMPFIMAIDNGTVAGYYFYDINAKINHKFSDKSRLYLSSYLGNDKFYYTDKYSFSGTDYYEKGKIRWGNITNALRWNYLINNKLFSNLTLTYSQYNFITGIEESNKNSTETYSDKFEYNSGIKDVSARLDFDYNPNPNNSVKFGFSEIYHTFNPGVNVYQYNATNSDNIDTSFGNSELYSHEYSVFIEDDIKLTNKLKANLGLNFSGFLVKEKNYTNWEPRASVRYLINKNMSLKASYARMSQYIHLLSNTSIGLPTDLWVPTTEKLKPEISDQVALGTVYNLKKKFEFSIEGFYKTMSNLLEYKEGASFFSVQDDWQDKVLQGKGWSYGAEFLIRKQRGKTTGWIGYTLSWTNRQFDGISFGEVFPYKYDRRHDIGIAITHHFTEDIDMGVTWVFGTGNAVTLATEKYPSFQSMSSGYYTDYVEYIKSRNNYRMPNYHRLDIGVNFHKKMKHGVRTWSFGLYNAYSRQNPFFIYYSNKSGTTQLYQMSLFPIIPSFRYNFKFN